MLIDTHCHLTDEFCAAGEMDAVIARARDAGVGILICPGTTADDIPKAIEIADKYENIFCTVGVHPEYAKNEIDLAAAMPDSIFKNPKIVGVGEIGLDYHYGTDDRTQQMNLFERQLDIARRAGLPVAIHSRDAEEDTAAILGDSVRGVMHCFTGSWDFAEKMLDSGWFFSASGILTFKNSAELRDTFAKIPIDKIVIETDSPFCAPVPFRGKSCEPAMITETARVLAEIKNISLSELESVLAENTGRLYPRILQKSCVDDKK
ncbi:MAG: TatD family hydrolase [Rickettsiales bacterium]|jgi:TatD DNase family protein|nr:TatD family hydrolase [Rickettsiales bacterium]